MVHLGDVFGEHADQNVGEPDYNIDSNPGPSYSLWEYLGRQTGYHTEHHPRLDQIQ